MPKILVVVQARLSSSRLPGKTLLPILGRPLILRQLERMTAAETPFELVVASTADPAEDPLVECVQKAGYRVFRGHPTDLLDRHYQAAKAQKVDAVVKIPSDVPLIDPAVIDQVLQAYLAEPEAYDFWSNLHPASYPDGMDVELMPFSVLEEAWQFAKAPHEREHTTPFIWDQPGRYRVKNLIFDRPINFSMSHRFTIDYREDYEQIRVIYERLWSKSRVFGLDAILELIEAEPWIYAINARYVGVNWYRNHLDVLKTVGAKETRSES